MLTFWLTLGILGRGTEVEEPEQPVREIFGSGKRRFFAAPDISPVEFEPVGITTLAPVFSKPDVSQAHILAAQSVEFGASFAEVEMTYEHLFIHEDNLFWMAA